jgi:hypothetical protein
MGEVYDAWHVNLRGVNLASIIANSRKRRAWFLVGWEP